MNVIEDSIKENGEKTRQIHKTTYHYLLNILLPHITRS